MKKLFLILSIVASTFALTSCGGSASTTEESTVTTEETATTETECTDTCVTETADTASATDTVSAN